MSIIDFIITVIGISDELNKYTKNPLIKRVYDIFLSILRLSITLKFLMHTLLMIFHSLSFLTS